MNDDIYSPKETDNELQAQIRAAASFLKKQSDEYWADPAAKTCGIGFPHTVAGKSIKIANVGEFIICVECWQWVEIPNGL